MTRYLFTALLVLALLTLPFDPGVESRAGFHGGVHAGGIHGGGAVAGPYGAGHSSFHSNSVVGPAGGVHTAGAKSGSYTTAGGSTIKYGAAGVGTSGPFGGAAGKGVGGVQVTTPGGQTYGKVGTAGGAVGPGGHGVGFKSGTGYTAGPYGAGLSHYQGGVAIGPHGAVAGGSKVGVGVGPAGGVYAGASHGGVAVGPYGVAAASTKVGVAGTGAGKFYVGSAGVARYGTYYASHSVIATHVTYVRQNFVYHNVFTPTWYARYPGAWHVAGWTAAHIWIRPAWSTVAVYCGYPVTPIYYDYGTTVVYQGDTVYINGESAGSAAVYAEQAQQLAAAGQVAPASTKADDWEPLGVFAVVQGEEKSSTNIFQLAINKQGIIKGNYYNALTDATVPLSGSVDQKTQRAAWTVGDKKTLVFEAGIANLTQAETTMLVHLADAKTQQALLVRLEDDKAGK